jgi:hypothetical protein
MQIDRALLPSLLLCAAGISAQNLLYDNGSIVTHPGGGAGGADVSALDNTTMFHTIHNVYGFGAQWASGGGNALADDFTVCGTWSITHVEVLSYLTNGVPPGVTGVYAQVRSGDPRLPGSTVVRGDLTTNLVTAPPIGTFHSYRTLIGGLAVTNRQVQAARVPVNWAPLPAGTYWFEFQVTGTAFVPPVTENEVNDTGDAIQRVTATWALANNAIAPATAGVAIPFRFYGTGGTPASASTYGVGKAGSNGVGAWDLGNPVRTPILGRDFGLALVNGVAGQQPTILIGAPNPGGIPLPPIGTLYVLPIFTSFAVPQFNSAHRCTVRLRVPHGAHLCGVTLGFQALWADPGATGFPLGHSDGLSATFGDS